MSSCDPCTSYNYIINNKSSQNLSLILYPEKNPFPDNPTTEGGVYGTGTGHLYDISYIGNESLLIDYPITTLNLKSKNSLRFFELSCYHVSINKDPEKGGSAPLWLQNNCIEKILIVNDRENSEKEISVDYWSNPANWSKRNKKSTSVEYWLVIDDEVIREHSSPAE